MKYTYLHLAVFSAILFCLCGGLLLFRWMGSVHDRQYLEEISSRQGAPAVLTVPGAPPLPDVFRTGGTPESASWTPGDSSHAPSSAWEPVVQPGEILPQYLALYQQNNDFIGWLEIPGTSLNLPVMYTPKEPEYYLRRLFDKSESMYGMPFLDGDCSPKPPSTNMILHGHHMTDGTMFSALAGYQEEAFFKAHPEIRFDTLYEEGRYEVIAAFRSVYDQNDASPDLYYNFIDAKDEQDFNRFITLVKGQALYNTGKTAAYGDTLITLITCMYDVENGRMNVVARKIK